MFIDLRPCPRCAAPRTLRLVDGRSLCCNCTFQWEPSRPRAPRQTPEADSLAYPFTPEELARLAAYRAAVQVGLYSDWSVHVGEVGRDGPGDVEPAHDPASPPSLFTPQELSRLVAYRAAVAAGLYSDQLPGGHPAARAIPAAARVSRCACAAPPAGAR